MIVGRLDKRTTKTLMRALCMVVIHVLADEFSQVRLTQRDDAVEAFFFDRADEAFDERVVFFYWIVPKSRGFTVVIVEQVLLVMTSRTAARVGLNICSFLS